MNWLCWHVGTVTDPKIGRIAIACKTARVNVLGVWAVILEKAKEGRGEYSFDADDVAFALDIDADLAAAIHAEMTAKGLVLDGAVVNWVKRQHGTSSAERVRKHRESKRDGNECNVTALHVTDVTPTDRQTNTQTDKDTTHYARAVDLPDRVEAALAQDMPVFGLTAAVDMLTDEGFTEAELIDTARSIAARGKTRVNPNYFIQAARGMKDDASRKSDTTRQRRNTRDASSPDAIGQRRAEILEGLGIGVSGGR